MRTGELSYLALLVLLLASVARAQDRGLKIIVLEGEGAFNNVRQHVGRDILVEVRDEKDRIVPGAEVLFTLPQSGASATFPRGALTYKTITDAQGRAGTSGLRPNSIEGRFNIKVTASQGGRTATAIISQSNTLAGGALTRGSASHTKRNVILLLLAGGATGGIVAATRGGSSSTPPSVPVPTTLSAGGVSVGGPR